MSNQTVTSQTQLIHNKYKYDENSGGLTVPINYASTFHQTSVDGFGPYDYGRSGNPTRHALEELIAEMEDGVAGFAFSSGMAAISTVLLLFSKGDHLLVTEDIYGGTHRIITKVLSRFGIVYDFVDMTNEEAIRNAFKENTKAVLLETPSNPTLKVTDVAVVSKMAKEKGALVIVDNTFLTPLLSRPLHLGADIVVHSATKFLAGHSDVVAGLVVAKDENLAREIGFLQNAFGAVLPPHDAWLVMRGIKTLHVRLKESCESAAKIAAYLQEHPKVKQVYYPNVGAVLSFEVADSLAVKGLVARLKLPAFAVSLGGVESILSYPRTMSHGAMSESERLARGITDGLLRLSVGLESVEDLMEDLRQGLEGI